MFCRNNFLTFLNPHAFYPILFCAQFTDFLFSSPCFSCALYGFFPFSVLHSNNVLGMDGASWTNFGYPRWQLVLCLAFGWIVAFLCLSKGIKSAGKTVFFVVIFPYVILTVLLVSCVLFYYYYDTNKLPSLFQLNEKRKITTDFTTHHFHSN